MHSYQTLVLALAAAGTASAHGNVQFMEGSDGGKTMGLGITGTTKRFGTNKETEKDTTVFPAKSANNPLTDGLGKTTVTGALKVANIAGAMKLAGPTLPQVKADGTGVITGGWRMATSDGTANNAQGELFAVIDSTGTGAYSKGKLVMAQSEMVGNGHGNVVQRSVTALLRTVRLLPRATNVGADAKFTVKIPAGTKCTGTAPGVTGPVCIMKIANNNGNGPFGGNGFFQISGEGGATTPAAGSAATPAAAGTGSGTAATTADTGKKGAGAPTGTGNGAGTAAAPAAAVPGAGTDAAPAAAPVAGTGGTTKASGTKAAGTKAPGAAKAAREFHA